MAKSAAFARIKKEVLTLSQQIPLGQVSSYSLIGEILEVMPRHVAYILAMLSEQERESVPWHRVVANHGEIKTTAHRWQASQMTLLEAEGHAIEHNCIQNFTAKLFTPQK